MQINGIGSNHTNDMHTVTNCMHSHGVSEKTGGASMLSQAASTTRKTITEQSQEPVFSLNTLVQNMLGGAKNLWGKIWGSNQFIGDVSGESMAGRDAMLQDEGQETMLQDTAGSTLAGGNIPTVQVTTAANAVPPPRIIENNPYFSTIEATGKQQQSLWEKIRVRFENITGYLTRQFSFSNTNSFQTKQEQPKEDMSRRSRYHKDEVEIDCVLTDESYLMDSYNRKGEYSTLSASNSRDTG